MKSGLSLSALAAKIEANQAAKADHIVDTASLRVEIDAGEPVLMKPRTGDTNDERFLINGIAHNQIAAHTEIPRTYYDRMRTADPELLAHNVNTWFARSPTKRMLRTMNGTSRAFLSNRYNRIENEEIAEVVLPILAEIPDVRVLSSEITESRMYIQALTPRIEGEVKKGDIVQAGVVISNSEVGHGAVTISPMVFRLVCLNGMISADGKLRANHVGGRIDETAQLYADDTRQADDRAILLKVRDHVRAAVDQVAFSRRVAAMAEMAGAKLLGDVEQAVGLLAKKVGATEGERKGILRSLIEGADLSAWGMINAVTHQAHTIENYDRMVEFERMGGDLLAMPANEWKPILQAA